MSVNDGASWMTSNCCSYFCHRSDIPQCSKYPMRRCLGTQNPIQDHLQKGLEYEGYVPEEGHCRKGTPERVLFCFQETGARPRTERDPELRVKIVESTRDFADDPVVWRPSRHWWYIFLAGGIGWGNLSEIIWDLGFRNYNFSLMRRVCDILLSTAGKDSERVCWGLKWWNTTIPVFVAGPNILSHKTTTVTTILDSGLQREVLGRQPGICLADLGGLTNLRGFQGGKCKT